MQADVDLGIDGGGDNQPDSPLSPLKGRASAQPIDGVARLRDVAPPTWWNLPDDFATAADAFDARHRLRQARAERFLHAAKRDDGSVRKANVYREFM